MMSAHLRGAESPPQTQSQPPTQPHAQGIAQAFKDTNKDLLNSSPPPPPQEEEETKVKLVLVNRAGESRSPYVQAHAKNPVAWQIWGDEALELAKRENRLLFLSIGYSACHWCHVMERESFENEEVATILNDSFIPIKIDREERPDLDRIYMNYVHATTGSGGWPLNVFVTPELEPVFGGTYWPGPNYSSTSFEGQVDFLSILEHLRKTWSEQEQRCRQDSAKIIIELKNFASEGTFGDKLGEGSDGLDIEILEEAYSHFNKSFDPENGGFDGAPKFPTPQKLAFLLRLSQYPQVVIDLVGALGCKNAQDMAITTLRKMTRGGIHDHIGNGFARYSVTADWSLPHFEKMLYDNAQLLHIYLDGFLLGQDAELLGTVYDIGTYLTTTLSHQEGGFYSSEHADSLYRKSDTVSREGAFYVWTKRELENILGRNEPIVSAFFNVTGHGNVKPEYDAQDEFIDQNVLAIVSTPALLAAQFGMKEREVIRIIKNGKLKLREHRERERVRPGLDEKIVTSWNGLAIGALSRTAAVMKGFDPEKSKFYLDSAIRAAKFIKAKLYDEDTKTLWRIYREGRGDTAGFADDYAFLIEGLIELYEATFDETWLKWADDLQQSQLRIFYDHAPLGTGAFFSTSPHPHILLRLKDGMDSAEPSTNGVSSSNLYRLSSLLADTDYGIRAKETIKGFESEILQYPWLFGSFMPGVVANELGVKGVVVCEGMEERGEKVRLYEKSPRGSLSTFVKLDANSEWLRGRNSLLKDFGKDGKERVMICEGGVCKEEVEFVEAPEPADANALSSSVANIAIGNDKKTEEPVSLEPANPTAVPDSAPLEESGAHKENIPVAAKDVV